MLMLALPVCLHGVEPRFDLTEHGQPHQPLNASAAGIDAEKHSAVVTRSLGAVERARRGGGASGGGASGGGIAGFTADQGVTSEHWLQACGADLADRYCVVAAAPTAPMLRLRAQER